MNIKSKKFKLQNLLLGFHCKEKYFLVQENIIHIKNL